MADFVATIKVQFQLLGLSGSDTRGGSGASGTSTSGADLSSVKVVNEEFAKLAAQVKAVTLSLNQIQNALGSLGGGATRRPGAGGIGASGSGNLDAASEALNEMERNSRLVASSLEEQADASRKASDASKKEATVKEEAVQGATELSKAESLLAEAHRKAAEQAQRSATSNEAAAKAEAARARAIKALDEGTEGVDGRIEGVLSSIRKVEDVFSKVINTRGLREQAAAARAIITDLFVIPKGASQEVAKEANKIKEELKTVFTDLAKLERGGGLEARDISQARNRARQILTTAREQLPSGQAPQFNLEEAFRRVGARGLTGRFDRITAQIDQFAKKLDSGVDSIEFSNLKNEILEAATALERFSSSVARGVFTSRSGDSPFNEAPESLRLLQAETRVRPPQVELEGRALKAFDTLRKSINASIDPINAVQKVVDVLVDEGQGLGQVGRNLRVLLDQFNILKETDFPDREAFLRFRDAIKELKTIKQNPATGALSGRAGTISQSTANVAAQRAIQTARERVASVGPGARDQIALQFPTATGGIRKVNVELEALGNRLDQVRVKAKSVSDNMFDRTSVRTALQRVATWGAAAGVVFGAVNAFRTGLDTLIETEAAIVSLAKVMDESTRDFEAFADAATRAATSIAQEFGQPLESILETLTLFGQQGENLRSSIELTRAAALAANVTVLDQTSAASTLTAVTAQFNIAASESISIIDRFNEVSNNAAVTEQILGDAILKAGQAAVNAGVSLDQFNGIVAAISEVTRQTGSEIGTALRFIFSRLQTEEAATGLASIGVAIRDASGDVRPFVDIITDIKNAFDGLTEAQKQQVSIAVSGTRRFNTFLALINNFSQFEDSTANSVNSANSAFREQERVAQTAGFRIRQLQNSLKELAVSFGDALLSPLKAVVGTLRGLVDIIAGIPGSFKVLAAGVGIGTLAFVKLTDQIVDLFGLTGSIQGFGRTFGGQLRRNLVTGIPKGIQAEDAAFATLGSSTIAARTVGDFAGTFANLRRTNTDVRSFSKTLEAAGGTLVTLRGTAVSSTSAMTKFGAVVRGLGVRTLDSFSGASSVAALSLLDLNSGLSRFLAFIGRIGNGILVFTRLDRVLAAVGGTVTSLAPGLGGVVSALGTAARFGAVAAAIAGVVFAFNALTDAAFESGKTIESSLRPELSASQEAIAAIESQRRALENLNDARRTAARLQLRTPAANQRIDDPLVQENIRRGNFRAPGLEQERLLQQEQEIIQSIITSRPELIDTIDEFGNVSLDSTADIDALAASADDLQKALFNLTQLKVIQGFADDLVPEEGVLNAFGDFLRSIPGIKNTDFAKGFASNIGNELEESRESLQDFLDSDAVKEARRLQIPLDFIDPDSAEEGRKKAEEVVRNTLKFRELQKVVDAQLAKLQPDADQVVFQSLATNLRTFFQNEATDLSIRLGVEVEEVDLVNRAFLRNRQALKGISADLVGATPEETIERFRESGIQEKFLDFQEDINRQLSGGELVIFQDIEGINRQAIVEVLADGRRQIKFISDNLGTFATRELQGDLAQSFKSIRIIDPDSVREQLDFARLELTRVATGAGRGAIPGDVDLGATFSFDLTGQQRAAQANERIFSDLFRQQEARSQRLEQLGVSATQIEQEAENPITANIIEEIRRLNVELDKTATIIKFRTAIEEVSRSFEQAVNEINRLNIGEAITSQLSGVFGAQRGTLAPSFQEPVLPGELNATQELNRSSRDLIALFNQLSRGEEATGEFVAGLFNAQQDIDRLFRDFAAAQSPGGIRDPERLTSLQELSAALRRQGVSREQALQTAIANDTLSEQQKTNQLLERILERQGDPEILARNLSSVVDERSLGDDETRKLFTEGLNKLSSAGNVSGISTPDLQFLARASREANIELPENLVSELVNRQSRAGSAELTSNAIGLIRRQAQIEASGGGDAAARRAETEVQSRELGNRVSQAISDAIAPSLRQVLQGGEASSITGQQRQQIVDAVVSSLRNSSEQDVRKIGNQLADASLEVGSAFQAVVDSAIEASLNLGSASASFEPRSELTRDIEAERDAHRELAQQIADTQIAFAQTLEPLGRSLAAVRSFSQLVAEAGVAARNAFVELADTLTVNDRLSQFAGPTTGPLRGLNIPQVEIDGRNLGGSVAGFSGRELASLANPQLASNLTALNDAVNVFQTRLRELELARQRALRAGRIAAEEGDLEAAAVSAAAVSQLDTSILALRNTATDARADLQRLGETFDELEKVNQFRANIEQLLDSFDREQELRFDRTSIETALGRGPFAFARPTFEQFESGQGGQLTAFERTLEDISSRVSSGALDLQGANRERSRAEFDRGEEIISFAQQRENQQFESQVRLAEQLREELARFASGNGPGSGSARSLLNQLTSELETAGNLLPGPGPQQITDPRTGQPVNIPASEVLQFQGIPSLDNVRSQVAGIADQVRDQQQRENADLISRPIVSELEIISRKFDPLKDISKGLADSVGVGESDKDFVGAANTFKPLLTDLQTIFRDNEFSAEESNAFASVASSLSSFDPEVLSKLIDTASISREGGTESVRSVLESAVASFSGRLDASGAVAQNASSVLNRANTVPDEQLTGKFVDFISQAVGGLFDLVTAVATLRNGFGDAIEAVRGLTQAALGSRGPQRFAAGGLVKGPGGPREDKVPVMASAGEYVLNARTVRSIGLDTLNQINQSAGILGSDSSIAGTPLISLQDGGSVGERLAELRRRQKALLENTPLSRADIQENALLTSQIDKLELERRRFLEERGAQRQALRKQQLRGNIRFGTGPNEPLVVVPDGSADSPESAAAIASEDIRLESQRGAAGTRGRFSQFGSGQIFARTRNGRLSFSGSSDRGGRDLADFAGVSTTTGAIDAESSRRRAFERQVKEERARLRSAAERKFIEEQGSLAEQAGQERIIRSFGAARAELINELNRRRSNLLGSFPRDLNTASDLVGTARTLLNGGLEEDLFGASAFNSSDFIDLADRISAVSARLTPVFNSLRPTSLSNVKLNVPPGLDISVPDLSVRRDPNSSSVGLDYNPLTGEFSPSIFGFSLLSNPGIESLVEGGLATNLDRVLPNIETAVRQGSRFSSFAARNNGARQLRQAITQFRTEQLGTGTLSTIASTPEFLLDLAATAGEGVVGQAGDIATGTGDSSRLFFAAATLGGSEIATSLSELPGTLAQQGTEIAQLELELERTLNPQRRLEIEKKINELGVQLSSTAGGNALAVLSAPAAVRGTLNRVGGGINRLGGVAESAAGRIRNRTPRIRRSTSSPAAGTQAATQAAAAAVDSSIPLSKVSGPLELTDSAGNPLVTSGSSTAASTVPRGTRIKRGLALAGAGAIAGGTLFGGLFDSGLLTLGGGIGGALSSLLTSRSVRGGLGSVFSRRTLNGLLSGGREAFGEIRRIQQKFLRGGAEPASTIGTPGGPLSALADLDTPGALGNVPQGNILGALRSAQLDSAVTTGRLNIVRRIGELESSGNFIEAAQLRQIAARVGINVPGRIASGEISARSVSNPALSDLPSIETNADFIRRRAVEAGGIGGLNPNITRNIPNKPFTLESGFLAEGPEIARARALDKIRRDSPELSGSAFEDAVSAEILRRERLLTERTILNESVNPGPFTEAYDRAYFEKRQAAIAAGETPAPLLSPRELEQVQARLREIDADLGIGAAGFSTEELLSVARGEAVGSVGSTSIGSKTTPLRGNTPGAAGSSTVNLAGNKTTPIKRSIPKEVRQVISTADSLDSPLSSFRSGRTLDAVESFELLDEVPISRLTEIAAGGLPFNLKQMVSNLRRAFGIEVPLESVADPIYAPQTVAGIQARGQLETAIREQIGVSQKPYLAKEALLSRGGDELVGDTAGLNIDGNVRIASSVAEQAIEAVRLVDEGLQVPIENLQAYSTLIHEHIHSSRPFEYRGFGIGIEELTTELAARRATAKFFSGARSASNVLENFGSYEGELIGPVVNKVADVFDELGFNPTTSIRDGLINSSIKYRNLIGPSDAAGVPLGSTGINAVRAFADLVVEEFGVPADIAAAFRRRAFFSKGGPADYGFDLYSERAIDLDGFYTGGSVSGPGGPTSDRVPILASNGEYVLNAAAVQRLGLPNVESMNRTGKLPGFQNGGLINRAEATRQGYDPDQLESALTSTLGGTSNVRVVNASEIGVVPGSLAGLDPSFSSGENFSQIAALAGSGGLSAGAVTRFDFDALTGDSKSSIDADVALRQLSTGGRIVFVNPRTGEEVIASPLAASELRSQGFVEKIDPDLATLDAIAGGAKIYENRRTGELITASPLFENQLRRDGFVRSNKPISSVLNKGLVVQNGGTALYGSASSARRSGSGLALGATLSNPASGGALTTRELLQQRLDGSGFGSSVVSDFSGPSFSNPASSGNAKTTRELLDERLNGFALGGSIRGPGGPHGDRIPILASNGEYILSAETVGRIGLPALNALNSGMSTRNLPKFQDGGLVGESKSGEPTRIQLDTASIFEAVKSAIVEAFGETSVPLDLGTAAESISSAIASAFDNLELPEVELASNEVTVSLDIPSAGIPIDTSSLNNLDLGSALGSDIRNRLEAVEGRSESNLEDLSNLLESIEGFDFDSVTSALGSINELSNLTDSLSSSLANVESKVDTQQITLEQSIDFKINERFNESNVETRLDARLNREIARLQGEFTRIDNLISKAITQASRAMTLAQAR